MDDRKSKLASLGARLAITRNELALSQAAMAKALGLSLSGYLNYERGNRAIGADTLILMHETFGSDLNWILLGSRSARVEHDLDALKDFQVSLDQALAERKLTLKSEKRATIVERWYKSKLEGREISMDDLCNWIDLLAD